MMMTSDPIADMLTRIRNANTAKHDTVDVPASKIKVAIAGILLDEGFIEKYDIIEDGNFKTIRITLKYGADRTRRLSQGLREFLSLVFVFTLVKKRFLQFLVDLELLFFQLTRVSSLTKRLVSFRLVEKFFALYGRLQRVFRRVKAVLVSTANKNFLEGTSL